MFIEHEFSVLCGLDLMKKSVCVEPPSSIFGIIFLAPNPLFLLASEC